MSHKTVEELEKEIQHLKSQLVQYNWGAGQLSRFLDYQNPNIINSFPPFLLRTIQYIVNVYNSKNSFQSKEFYE